MKSRMEELSEFYDLNLDDPKSFLLEKLRLRLKKALMYKITGACASDISGLNTSDLNQDLTSNSFVS